MSKRRVNKPKEVKPQKPSMVKVVFIKNFEGSLNNWKVKSKKGDTLNVLPFRSDWLKQHGAIE